jgi:hypothetical protein
MSLSNNRIKSTTIYGALKTLDNPGLLGIGAVPASFDLSGNGVFRGGVVNFADNLPTCSQTPTTGTQLITKAFADATYIGSDVKITNNVWTGTNAFNTYLPTSTLTPSSSNELITKAYGDANYTGSGVFSSNNTWTGTNTFNTYAPSSSVAPSSANDLCNKTYVDLKAPIASPALTGTPTAPTQSVGDNSTKIATTAFVLANQPSLASYAPLASPALTGNPTAPTQTAGDNSTKIATTAFVLANSSAGGNESLLLQDAQCTNLDYDNYSIWTTTAGASASGTASASYTTAISSNGKISYFAGSGDGVYRSSDYFQSTTAVNSTPTTYRGVCCSSDGKYVFTPTANITPGTASAWFYSSNYGTNWTPVNCTTAGTQTGQVGFDKPVMSGDGKYVLMTVSSPGNLNNIFLSSNYGATFAVLPFTQTQQVSVYPIVMSLTGQYMTVFQYYTGNAVCYYSKNYGVSWTVGASVPKMTTACMSAYGETITALGTSSNSYYISTDYGASFTTLTNTGLNSAGQQIACNDSGQFQLVIQSSTNTVWGSYDYGRTFVSQVITLNNTPGTAFAIAGTWWNLSMSADGRYAITAGGNSGTPIALKLQVKEDVAKNVLAKGMKIYEEGGASPILQYLAGDGTNYNYLYPSVFDNWFVFRSFRTGGFVFMDTTGTNSCTIDNSGGITTTNIKAPSLNNNIKPYTNPLIAETVPRYTITTTEAYGVGRIVFCSIYLTAGTTITGVQGYVYVSVAGTSPQTTGALFDSTGVLLANSSAFSTSTTQTRQVYPFTTAYKISTTGSYIVGIMATGVGTTFQFPSTPATLGNIYNNTLSNGGLGGPTTISCGQGAMTTIGNITGTCNARSQVYWFGLY